MARPPRRAQERSPADLWFINGRAYDLREFVDAHPGGRAALMLARGTNCTELFHSYHLMRGPSKARMAKYEVEVDRSDPAMLELLGSSRFTFEDDDFYKTVARRVKAYFKDSGQPARATLGWQVAAVVGILLTIALTIPAFVWGSLGAALALGFVRAIVSVGPGHSMSHFAVFPRGRWNSLVFRLGSPFLVSTWPIWTNTHVRSHHVDTLTGVDLQDNYPLKRIHESTPHRAWHRVQHFYIWPIYLVGLPLWAMQDFVGSLVSLVSRDAIFARYTWRERLENVLAIAINLVMVVVLPFLFLDWQTALLVCLASNAVSSLLVIVQIVVNHEVCDTMERSRDDAVLDWGAHQVLTSHNYGVDSWLALHLSGGLNMQVEHHLFPGVHYIHYPALSEIVREACVEFGLPYYASRDIWEAISKHYRVLELKSVPDHAAMTQAAE